MKHKRHRVSWEEPPGGLTGMCQCPGCYNAFAMVRQHCKCGAYRDVCSGMGTASLASHVAYGFSHWHDGEPREGER